MNATAPLKARLLLVDDDRLVLSTLASGLLKAGYGVKTAESAEEAEMLLASGEDPDLAILDIRMSGQDGLFLARRPVARRGIVRSLRGADLFFGAPRVESAAPLSSAGRDGANSP